MLKKFIPILLFCPLAVFSQTEKTYSIENTEAVRHIDLSLKSAFGAISLRPTNNPAHLKIFGKLEKNVNESFKQNTEDGRTEARLVMQPAENHNGNGEGNTWDVYPSKKCLWDLDMNMGMGNANVDLSDLKLKKFKVASASADVWVSYMDGHGNMMEMDSFWVQTEVGNIIVNKANLARAKNIFANVAFGSLELNFSDNDLYGSKVKSKVGAGNLKVRLPKAYYPIIIRVQSGFVKIKTPEGFEVNDQGHYVNEAYLNAQRTGVQKKVLEFDVEISVGTASFVY